MKQFLLLIVFLLALPAVAQHSDTIYFDQDWKVVSKNEADFFRPPPQKEGNLYVIEDYYIKGQLQYRAKAKDIEGKQVVGEARWFFKEGNITQIATYNENYETITFAEYYHDVEQALYKVTELNKTEDRTDHFLPTGEVYVTGISKNSQPYSGVHSGYYGGKSFGVFENGALIATREYYINGQIAEEVGYEPIYPESEEPVTEKETSDEIIEEVEEVVEEVEEIVEEVEETVIEEIEDDQPYTYFKFYDLDGTLIEHFIKNQNPQKEQYKKVYFHTERQNYSRTYLEGNFHKCIYKIITFDTATKSELETAEYDNNCNLKEKGSKRYGMPFNGVFSNNIGVYLTETVTYKNGKRDGKAVFYNPDSADRENKYANEFFWTVNGEGFYKEDQPWNGDFIEEEGSIDFNIWHYENGEKIGKQIIEDRSGSCIYHLKEGGVLHGLKKGDGRLSEYGKKAYFDIEYKDGEPFEGIIVHDDSLTYSKGVLHGKQVYGFKYGNGGIEKWYDKGELLSESRFDCVIAGEHKKLKGRYKNEKAHEGYFFKNGKISYYEDGKLLVQYSRTQEDREKEDKLRHFSNKIKFKNGRASAGEEKFRGTLHSGPILYENGKTVEYALHRNNEIPDYVMKANDQGYEITFKKGKIKVQFENKIQSKGTAVFTDSLGIELGSFDFEEFDIEDMPKKPEPGTIIYYYKDIKGPLNTDIEPIPAVGASIISNSTLELGFEKERMRIEGPEESRNRNWDVDEIKNLNHLYIHSAFSDMKNYQEHPAFFELLIINKNRDRRIAMSIIDKNGEMVFGTKIRKKGNGFHVEQIDPVDGLMKGYIESIEELFEKPDPPYPFSRF